MWKQHVLYDFRHCSVIVTLGGQLYRVLEVVTTIAITLLLTKQCQKVIYQNVKFVLFMV
jgi:hypothetical protein